MASVMGTAAAAAPLANPAAAATAPAPAATATAPGAWVAPRPKAKKLHGRAFYESIGSPKFIIAPMVDQSEFAWRMLTRSFLPEAERSSILAYSPMLHARLFAETPKYRSAHFEPLRGEPTPSTDRKGKRGSGRGGTAGAAAPAAAAAAAADPTGSAPESSGRERGEAGGDEMERGAGERPAPYLDGNPSLDRPLFVQFCANDPAVLLAAARAVAPHCDAVDLNLGCPQGIARKGQYGAFLQERQGLVADMIRTLHEGLPVPVTAKIRVLDTPEATLAYARTLLAAGASILTVHGRRREQKGHLTGVADWPMIRYLRENLPPDTVLFANGNILQHGDLEMALAATGADGIMSAEGNLSDPALFMTPPPPPPPQQEEGSQPGPDIGREFWRGKDGLGGWRVDAVIRRYLDILYKYCLGLEEDEMPVRRLLFCPGDDEAWMAEEKAKRAQQEAEEPARKRRKNEHASAEAAGDDVNGNTTTTDPKGTPADDKASKQATAALATSPNLTACQPHMFHLLRHFVTRHHDVRDMLARSARWASVGGGGGANVRPRRRFVDTYEAILALAELKIAEGLLAYERTGGRSIEEEWAREAEEKSEKLRRQAEREAEARRKQEEQDRGRRQIQAGSNKEQQQVLKEKRRKGIGGDGAEGTEEGGQHQEVSGAEAVIATSADAVRRCRRPWWVCQPIVRPLPSEALLKGAIKPKGSGKGLDRTARQEAAPG